MRFDGSIRRAAVLALSGLAVAPASSAAAARVLNVRDEGHLHLISSEGSELIDEGPATGTVPGKVRVHFVYNGNPAVSAQFTIYGHSGSISGRAKARLSNPTSPEPSFRGAFTITGAQRPLRPHPRDRRTVRRLHPARLRAGRPDDRKPCLLGAGIPQNRGPARASACSQPCSRCARGCRARPRRRRRRASARRSRPCGWAPPARSRSASKSKPAPARCPRR